MKPLLSIIIPAYNESAHLSDVLVNIENSLKSNQLAAELIVVDDCSTDDTLQLVKSYMAQNPALPVQLIESCPNRGKGYAIRQGIAKAKGEFLLIQDADHEYDPRDYPNLLAPLIEDKADVVYGSRFAGGNPHRMLFFWHSIGNRFLTALSNSFTNLNLTDMETGYKVFRTNIIQQLQLCENRFGIEPEITAKISRVPGIRIYEVGISYHGRTFKEGKKINWKDGFKAIYCILKYNRRKLHPPRQYNKWIGWALLVLLGVVFGIISWLSKDSYGGGDDLHHYRLSRYAFDYPRFFFDHWGKPVFTLLSAPFSQMGYLGAKFYNLLAALLAAFFSWRLAIMQKLDNAWMAIPFVLFAPVFAALIPSAMTEITGAFFLAFGFWLYFRKNYVWAAVAISFLPFVRTEGMFILPLFGLMFLLRRQWLAFPALFTGTALYTLVGGWFFGDYLWIVNQFPYSSKSADIYGSGSLLYYIDRAKFIWGIPLTLFFVPGLMKLIYELFQSRFTLKKQHIDEFVLIFLSFFGVLAFHSLAWYMGTGALALDRFMILVVPPFIFISLKGYNTIEHYLSLGQHHLAYLLKVVALYLVVITAFAIYKLPVPMLATNAVIKQACDFISEEGLDQRMIYFYNPSVFFMLGIDPHDQSRIREAIPDRDNPGNKMKAGGILVWDAHFGPNEGRLPLERIQESGNFETLGVFKPVHPFQVLGGYNYEVYVFEYIGGE
jgi:glycosyltransferase involved in cell wall biosynthesis